KRVFGSYDGGGDESFTYFNGIEMSDGRAISAELLRGEAGGIDCERLVEDAAFALMGRFDAGNFQLHGVVIIDFDTCRITDERDADVVFGHKMPWEVSAWPIPSITPSAQRGCLTASLKTTLRSMTGLTRARRTSAISDTARSGTTAKVSSCAHLFSERRYRTVTVNAFQCEPSASST